MNDFSLPQIAHLLRDINSGRYEELALRPGLSEDERELLLALNQTHRHREELLRQGQARSRLIIDSTPVAICITNENGIYEYANPRYQALTEYDATELIGRHFSMVVPQDTEEELTNLHDEFMGRRYELAGRWRIVSKSGRSIPILANAAYVIDIDGEPKKVTFVIDITEIERAHEQLEREIEERRQLEHVRNEVERVMQHDLRNPIDGIRTAADYLLQEDLDERAQEFVRLMYDAAVRLRNRIDNSLAYTRMRQGRYQVQRERVNMVQLVRDVVKSVEEARLAYRAEVVTTYRGAPLSEQYDIELWGENGFLMDAIGNLVRNALEASNAGDVVSIDVDEHAPSDATPTVEISIHNPADVPKEIRANLFEAYVTHGKRRGTGLGTYTARLVCDAHDGSIEVRTGEGDGTTMTLMLPRGRPGELL